MHEHVKVVPPTGAERLEAIKTELLKRGVRDVKFDFNRGVSMCYTT